MKIALINGNVVTDKVEKANVLIEDGVIAVVTTDDISADVVKDCAGMHVIPGLIDMHVHLREPGFEYKEDLQSGAETAIAGGVTTICSMANTSPVVDNRATVEFIRRRSAEIGLADILPYATVTKGMKGEELSEMGDLLSAGACGFSDDGKPVMNAEVMRRALEYASYFGAVISAHEEDEHLFNHGSIHEGKISSKYGMHGAPAEAESVMIARDVELARLTKSRVHICHVSSKYSVDIIRRAKESGINVTAEVTPYHLTLTEDVCTTFDTNTKINPPFRSAEDRLALIEGLKSGVIDCIASDHAPHHLDDKFKEYDLAAYGLIGLQLSVPMMMELIRTGGISWVDFATAMSANPAKVLQLDKLGKIAKGYKADIAVIDAGAKYTFDENTSKSKSRNTPFWGKEITGMAKYVLKNGKLVLQ